MNAKDYFLERDSAPFRALLAEMLNLGQVEIVDTWKEGNIHFQKMVTVPDYERWVPTIGRKYVKEEDIMFYDTIAYDPQELESEEKGFRMHVTSYLPLLDEESDWMDPEWVRALEESTNNLGEADAVTAAALVREERRALARLRKMAPSHIRTVLLSCSSFHERTGPLKRNREDEEKRKRFNADAKKWRQFWRKAHPAAPPVPSITAQAFHLLSISAAVGWIKMHAPSKQGSGEKEKAKPQGERLAQVKKLFGKMHLGKKEHARVTTPAALP
ncbi:hypothetical protein WJX75_006754 [Coccomyxa subellipsoidea]|uniref:Potassium channel tetramerisation-type BTB domain-containing protein n=1 Tax=Coccomyxa subellipsoidea TaxID=248742 RepID=A0ABR2Z0K9_9CHLO